MNLLRGIAALLVLVYHLSGYSGHEIEGKPIPDSDLLKQTGSFGITGVYIFFVISGFVIPFSMYKGEYSLKRIGRFLLKRSLRIEIPYIAAIFLIILFNIRTFHSWGMEYEMQWDRFFVNLFYLVPLIKGYDWYGVIFWTLAIEFQFYLLMAILFPLLNHRNRVLRSLVLLLFTSGPLLSGNIAFIPLYGPCFTIGFLLFLAQTGRLNIYELFFWLLAAAGMNYMHRDMAVVISTTLAFLFISFLRSDTRIGNRLGDISYSLYLTHGIIVVTLIQAWYNVDAGPSGRYPMLLLVALVCLASAFVFWFIVEKPSLYFSRKLRLKKVPDLVSTFAPMSSSVTPYQSPAAKKEQVAEMFDNIAHRYDFLNQLFSLGIHKGWRRKSVKKLMPLQPKQLLDVATGTGDFAIELNKRLAPEKVTGVDISEGMMKFGREKLQKLGLDNKIELLLGDSANLPFADNSFDAITVGFGVRNFENLEAGLAGMYRVLRPGGMLVVLEFSRPRRFPVKQLYNFYFHKVVPFVGRIFSKDSRAYTYLPESVDAFPDGNDFLAIMGKTGFCDCSWQPLTFGIASIYTGRKPR